MTTKLTTVGGTLKETLEQDPDYIDLMYDNGVITVITIKTLLYDEWRDAQSDYIDWKNRFDIDNVTKPGVYREDEIYEHGDENCYTIVVDYGFIPEKLVQQKIQELNHEYDKDFEIKNTENRTVEL